MTAFEFAMKMELDGKSYYEKQADKMTHPALKKLFSELASDEERHYQIFKEMSAGKKPEYEAAFKTSILATTKNVFQKLSASKTKIDDLPDSVREAWGGALDIEDKSVKFYHEQAGKVSDSDQKRIWNSIAAEEQKHWTAINYVIDFISRPKQWLEDAEWSNIEPY